ncbi:MAG: hypothetical protein F9K24_21885 [Leptonema illini]|uniref:SMI1/KNR4 family protein n=1 Tax=Leptonema illini TaxID=183 RepID=A0A833GWN2_9LEPT|nr:MAG: hypothetical protein F9K24_21885 [Leptonema illini]
MNIAKIKNLIQKKTDGLITDLSNGDFALFEKFLGNDAIAQYLKSCISKENYVCSDINICGLERLIDENFGEASPGIFIADYGYLIIGTSIGGNAICFCSHDSYVYWANTANFSVGLISYEDKSTGRWVELMEYNSANVQSAMILLSTSIEDFLVEMLTDSLAAKMAILD